MQPTKGTTVHIWVQDETNAQLEQLSDILEMSKNDICGRLIVAGLKALKESGLKVKSIIGGAPVTQNFADEIGASGYAPDAASAVDIVRKLIGA